MNLCRCPHCGSTFQVHIPHDSVYWDTAAFDEDGLAYWVCLDCHKQGKPAVSLDELQRAGHDTSYR
ncbi:MAG: hypothetical protein H6817_10405 [Phycisphaerales bacterium]|nr:hypothetical protein [Phycisphaerales bacterium]